MTLCWHHYGRGKPIERGGVWHGRLMIKIRKICSKCDKPKEYWTAAAWIP